MRHRNFTLVELLVALGVFSILLVIFMQFFSGMRLAWTNTERRTDAHYSVRIAMDLFSNIVGSMYYTNAATDVLETTVQFPFMLKRADSDSSKPAALYLASKGNVDLPGSCPVKFIGIQYVNPINNDFKFGLGDEKRFYAIYLTVVSNADKDAEGKDIADKNREIYNRFWPAPDFLDANNEVTNVGNALQYLVSVLDKKLDPGADKPVEYVKLLDHVTEFKIRLFDANGSEIDANSKVVCRVPHSLELTVSVLSDADFEAWLGNGKNEEFRLKRQLTFTRRIHIGERWNMEDKYDKY